MNLDEWLNANDPIASSAALVPAADGNPMQAAEAVAQARRNNIPPSLVGMQPDPDIARQNKIEDTAAAVRASPTLDEWLATQPPPVATSVMDDIHFMSAMGNLSRNYFVGKSLSGIYSLAGSVARFGEQAIPGATEEDITSVYRNDPTKMMQMISNPPAYQLPLVLAKLAREMQAKSEQADAAINPTQKTQYDSLRYATLDPNEAAYLSPGRVIGDVMQSLPSTAALMATVLLTRGAGMTAEKQALASGLTQAEARTAATEAAMKMAAKSGAIGEGAVGFGQQYNDVFSQVYSSNLESSKEYSDLRGQGMDDAAARTYLASHAAMGAGLGAGVVDAVTNLVGGKYLGKIIGEGGNLLPRVARGFANEAATETVQGAGEQLASNQALDAAGIPTDLLNNVGESAIAGLVVGGVTGGAFAGALGRSARNEADASQAMNTSRVLTELSKLAGATQIRGRDVDTLESFLQSATDGTPLESVYIDAGTLADSGVLNQLMEASPTVAAQMDQARGGTMIRIPVSEAIGRFHGELAALIPDMRTDPNGMTQREAEAYVAERGPALQAEVERILQEDSADTEAHDARLRVKDSVAQELMATGRVTKDVADVYSTLTSTFYHVMGRRMGKNAEQLYGEERLRILGDGQGELGQVATLDQGDAQATDKVDERTGLPLNADGTVTLYHHTSAANAGSIKASGALKSAGEPSVYLTTRETPDTGYGDTAVKVRIDPATLELDDEFPNGRKDFSVPAQGAGGALTDAKFGQPFGGPETATFGANDPNILHQLADRVRQMPAQIAATADVGNARTIATSRKWATNRDFKMAMQRAVLAVIGQRDLIEDTPTNRAYITQQLLKEAREALITNANAVGWYDGKVTTALEVLATIHPELKTDEQARFAFIWALAVTSNGVKVNTNFELAERAYSYWKANNNRLPTSGIGVGTAATRIHEGLKVYNDLIARWGFDRFRSFATTLQPNRNVVAEYGRKVSGEGMSTMVFGAGILGPKIGNGFFMNLNGEFGQLTMDRWWIRMWGRITGDLVKTDPAPIRKSRESLLAVIGLVKADPEAVRAVEQAIGAKLKKGDPIQTAKDIAKATGSAEVRSKLEMVLAATPERGAAVKAARGSLTNFVSIGDELRKSANNYLVHLDGQIEEPGGSKRRDMIRAVTTNVLTELQKDNPFLTMADLQALMWYPEKTLYDSSGAVEDDSEGYNDDEAPDYANAAIKLAKKQGISNAEIEAAVGNAKLDIEARQRSRRSGRGSVLLSENDRAGAGAVPGSDGELAQQSRGSFSPAELTIRLTKAQDLSTFLHESGHFYLHMLASLASRADAPADIKTDADVVLSWLGVEPSPERGRVGEWLSMSVDEQRDMHEKFARGFEGYLSEGKAPSVELAGMFAKFRSWLTSVYRALLQGGSTDLGKALNAQLSPEVRAVFGRMLATEDEIRNAEISRSMGMMFASEAEAREYGVDWDAYQKQALAATDEAISAMDAKSIRDMKWLGNARSKLLTQLQREAKELRRVVRMGARTEVLSQPVYRAYQFLTGKLSAEDKLELAPGELRKSKLGPVDPTIDSLFVAIAKLGGLTREQVQSEWGIDPAENVPNALFGLPVVRASAGGALQAKSIDGMLESLAQFGYFPLDENERAWTADFEDAFDDELRGNKHFSSQYDPTNTAQEEQAGASVDLNNLGAARIDEGDLGILLRENGMPANLLDELQQRRMVAKRGVHPELLAQQFGFSSGAELVEALAAAVPPKDAIESLTDQRMLEQHSDLATPEGREQAVTEALAGEARTRMVATELAALEKANKTGRGQQTLPAAAREFARNVIARLKVRDIRPGQYSGSASRASRAADKARKAGKVAQAALEKRNQLVNTYAARFASEALDEVTRGLEYLKKFVNEGTRKNLDIDYLDQIDSILERYDLRKSTIKGLDKRKALSDWIAEQEADGLTPDLPAYIEDPRQRSPYQELTVEEFRGLVDSVKQIEHFGRLKKRLLLAKDRREFAATVADIEASIDANAAKFGVKAPKNDTRTDIGGRLAAMFKAFTAAHRKFASLVYQMDGFADGPLWQALVRTANERGNWEATQQAKLTKRLAELMRGLKRTESPFSRGRYFSGIDMSLTHEQRLTVALNWGNDGNRQRLLDGRGWSDAGVQQVLATLTKGDWDFVQGVWNTFESLRPAIAEKERRLMGKEPNWVEAVPVQTQFGTFPGGYYPAVYDPRTNLKASENEDAEAIKRQLQGARSAATTRRNFVKARATEVRGRPLLLTMDGMFRGLSDVVHDLAIHEWAIDANRLLRALDPAIRQTYGADVINQLRSARDAIVAGEATVAHALDAPLRHIRIGSMVAGLGFNLVNSVMQPLGLTQSVVRIGGRWVAQGVGKFLQNPLALGREVMEKSEFMQNRARTQNRELNELRNRLRGKSNFRQFIDAAMFYPMTTMQLASDLPTWWGAYQKALTHGQDEDTAVQVADQAVIASQGGGQIKDLAAIQRGGAFQKLFTVFYGYFSTAYNLGAERYQQTNKKNPMEVLGLMGDFLMLYSVPAVLGLMVKEAFKGGGGDDDEELLAKLEREQLSYLFGLMVGVREAQGAASMALGLETKGGMGYSGPAGLRFLQALSTFAQQANQGDADRALARAAVNVAGIALHLPSVQINRTIDGIIAISEGRTENPLAIIGGAPPK